jgi:hypothetical protein
VLAGSGLAGADEKNDIVFETLADVGFGFVDEDGFVLLYLEQGLAWKGLDIRLSAPFRLRVIDRSPKDDGVLRRQDWDEGSDFARIARSISYVQEWDDAAVDLYFGELNGVGIGYGALMDAYFNSTDVDHYQGGLLLKGEWAGNGLEFSLENIVFPEVLVGRAFVAPLAWFLKGEWPRRLEIGYTLGGDIHAPYQGPGSPQSGQTRSFLSTGADLSLRVVETDWAVIMPYAQLMAMDGDPGVHVGLATSWVISETHGVSLGVRGEYRYSGSDYHPAIFNPFYEYNRRFYGGTSGSPRSFIYHLENEALPERHGGMVDVMLEWEKGLRFSARYDTEGRNYRHWVMFRLELFPWDGYNLGVFYAGQDIDGGIDLFSGDALMGLSLRARLWKPIDLFAEFTRRWRRQGDDMGMSNEIGGGVGVSISY